MISLAGQGYVVLGAGGGGIGNATVNTLAAAGARVLCVDVNAAEAEAAARDCGGVAHVADIRKRAEVEGIFDRAVTLFQNDFSGCVDVVGVARLGMIADAADADIDWQFDMIFRHAFLAIQSAAPRLAARGGGSITLVGSRAGIKPAANQALYGSAKAALHHLMRVSAIEYGPAGIRVNVVAPGFVRTPRVSAALPPEVWERIEQSNPLRRAAEPQDVADAILYLSSDLARYVTGNVLSLDGAGDNPLEGIGVRMAAPKV